MIGKFTSRGLIIAWALLGAASVLTAEDSADELITQTIAGAKTNGVRAAKLLEGAMVLSDQPKLCVALLEKAVEFGLKSPVTPAASKTAAQAIDLLVKAAPDRKDDWTIIRADVLNARYRCTRGATEKRTAANEFMAGLLAAAAVCEGRGSWTMAAAKYRQAGPVAAYLKDGSVDEVRTKLKSASYMATMELKAKRYADALKKDPTKASTRTMLIKTLLVELNNPAKAAVHLNEDVDELWRMYIPMACKPLEKLKEDACKKLGDWYRKSLSKACSTTAKPVMLARAKGYYQQFLTLHTENDIAAISIRAALAAIQKEAAGADAGFSKGIAINLLRSVDIAKHTDKGTWTTKAGVLTTTGGRSFAKITLPWIPEGSYELKIAFIRKSGREIALMLPVGDSATIFCVGMLSYPLLRNSSSPSTIKGVSGIGKLTDNTEYAIQVKVIVKKDQAEIRIGLNGKLALEWKGAPKQLSPYRGWALPDKRTLGLGVYSAVVDFKQASLRMTSGRATKFIAKAPPTKKPPTKTRR